MKIQVGKFYKNKSGGKAKVVEYLGGDSQDYRVSHGENGAMIWHYENGEANYFNEKYDLISEWKEPEEMTYKTWGGMTPEEKGALLLAHHEGKTIQFMGTIGWVDDDRPFEYKSLEYRIKPEEPKIEEKVFDEVHIKADTFPWTFSIKGEKTIKGTTTVTYTDGKPTKMVWTSVE